MQINDLAAIVHNTDFHIYYFQNGEVAPIYAGTTAGLTESIKEMEIKKATVQNGSLFIEVMKT